MDNWNRGQPENRIFNHPASPCPAGRASREQRVQAAERVLREHALGPNSHLYFLADAIVTALDRLSPSGEGEEP